MKAKYKDFYCEEEVTMEIIKYHNGNLAIQLWCEEDNFKEPFAMLSVNLDKNLPEDCAYIDVNNLRCGFDFCIIHNLGEFTGIFSNSGFCTYPLFKFNLDEVRKYAD